MQTSDKGIIFLKRHEGDVLKAYRDPVGVWTIGPGLTSASGVVTPKAGMTITAAQSAELTRQDLTRNYEPAVTRAMPNARQNEFDGAISFHWNTGAIGRASWVKKWLAKDWSGVQAKLGLWTKGGGRVLPGLVRRRGEEFSLIRYGIYQAAANQTPASGNARIALAVTADEIAEIREAFAKLGYHPGADSRGVSRMAVRSFQEGHDLTVDGILGRATLSTLQRMLDARAKTRVAGSATAISAPTATATDMTDLLSGQPWAAWTAWGLAVLCLFWLAWLAFTYRDALAARLAPHAPGLASRLRSF